MVSATLYNVAGCCHCEVAGRVDTQLHMRQSATYQSLSLLPAHGGQHLVPKGAFLHSLIQVPQSRSGRHLAEVGAAVQADRIEDALFETAFQATNGAAEHPRKGGAWGDLRRAQPSFRQTGSNSSNIHNMLLHMNPLQCTVLSYPLCCQSLLSFYCCTTAMRAIPLALTS